MERDQRDSRTSTMNFGERLWTPDDKQIQMNGSWVPITPEKPILTRSHQISAQWQENEMRIENLQEIVVPGSGYMNEMMHYNRPDQNLHLEGHTGEYNSFDGGSSERNRIINQIAGSYPQDLQYVMNFDVTTSIVGGRALLTSFHPLAGIDGRYFSAGGWMLNQSNNYSCPESMYKDMDTLIPTINSEFDRSRSNSFLNNIHYSVSNPLKNDFPDTLHGGSCTPCRPEYDLHSTPATEADPALDFNSLQSRPLTINNQVYTVLEHTIAESASPEKDMQGNLIASTDNNIQDYCNGLLQNIVDSSSAAIATPERVRNDSENNNCGKGSGLGFDLNKTPDQKAPKRRKHRPKVVVEGKGKRTKRAPIQKKTESSENPPRKRKYVCKNAQKAATTQPDVIIENADSSAATRKSCQRALNFDLEESRSESKRKVTVQQEVQHRNKAFKIISDNQDSEPLVGTNIMCGRNSALLINEQDGVSAEIQQARPTDGLTLVLNQKSTDTLLPERQAAGALSETTEQQYIENLLDTQKNSDYGNCDLYQGRVNGCIQQHIHTEGIGNIHFQSERNYEIHQNTNALLSQRTLQLVPNIQSNSCEERGSKKKHYHVIENQDVPANNSLGSSFLCPEIFQVEEDSNGTTMDKGFLQTQKRKKTENRIRTSVSGSSSYQIISEGIRRKVRRKGKEKSQSQFNDELSNCQIESKRLHGKQNVVSGKCTGDNFTDSGAPNQTYPTTIDEIICRLNNLNLREGNTLGMDEQSALVPYMGAGSVVPLELEKKRKPRPRVELDPETERMWRLLMGKEGSEGLEETDEEKEKWWEEERKVFRGRADSFIARMHLVQGDRRFSQWKGSVVDSVIGVFLTQNVSDHLSSSAFLSLAARFRLNSTSNKKACNIIDTNQLVEDSEVCIVNPDDTIILYGRLLGQSSYYEGSMTPNNTINGFRDTETSGIKGSLISSSNQSSEEEIISFQDSFDSSITQGTGGFRSCLGSNSEEEGPTTSFKHSKTQFATTANSSQVEKTTMFQEFYKIVNGVSLFSERTKDIPVQDVKCAKQNSRSDRDYGLNSHPISSNSINSGNPKKPLSVGYSTDYELNVNEAGGTETFEMLGGKSSWPETCSIVNELQDTSYTRYSTNKVGGSEYKSTEQQYGPLGTQEFPTMNPYGSLGNHLIHLQDISQSRSYTSHYQPSKYHIVGKETLGQEGMSFTESLSTCQELGRGQDDVMKVLTNKSKHRGEGWERISAANRQMHTDDSRVQLEPQQQVHSSNHKRKFNISNSRKEKLEKEKKNELDWDNLRKQVHANGGKKERSKDTMDSLDYEAVRYASVKEISEAIKERGMNNMLAERIQELLNRLVAEHGSIDLEWLRDVPPDKAKDYLLSIRGLGLKSVECVRLLTLHHLAFPVDTNVGRIAVRLGWVPLQPLPESLQLHLLELYPILESIQKYLWPRLCKLDQKTLYELHYQMITFGKVFCTKSKPNCNACPLRAECRHFASAFASARLALPGPEEKHIVSSTVPIAADRKTAINMNPAPLPLPANNLFQDASCETGMCEPIIEEPATPEQEFAEAWESDIEDSFYEDPDEIPTIKISMEEMTTTIQNYIQGNMQIQEGDMSKALVALNPEAASIPTPKLKNVSRLRTEHQVYEIPDAHALLEKMDKRESDDPSPYLLAIWTPGETANSVNPPERRCQSQDSAGLCNDITCFLCNSIREVNSQTVRGTLLIPCRTATRGSFPLNGTYFQVNELFADHASSIEPLDVPREWLWNLPRRTVYFGTSVSAIFRGLSTQEIQQCFWRGFVCVRGFDRETRSPRPLMARLHYPASKLAKAKK